MNSFSSSVLEGLSTSHLSFATQIQISNRERRQKIALKCLELENMLETKGMSAHEIEAKVSNFRMLLLRQTPLTAASPLATNGPVPSSLFPSLPNLQSHLHRHLPNGLLSTRAALQFLKAETRKTFLSDKLPRKEIIDPYYRRIYRRKRKHSSSRRSRSDRKHRGSKKKKKKSRKSSRRRRHHSDYSDYSDYEESKESKGKSKKRKYDSQDEEEHDDTKDGKGREGSTSEGHSKDKKRRKKQSSRKRSCSRGRSRTRKPKKKKRKSSHHRESGPRDKETETTPPNEFKSQESKGIFISKIEDLPTLQDGEEPSSLNGTTLSNHNNNTINKQSSGKIQPFEISNHSKSKVLPQTFNEASEDKKKLKFPKFLPKMSGGSTGEENIPESSSGSKKGVSKGKKTPDKNGEKAEAGEKEGESASGRKSRSRSREARSYSRESSDSRSQSSSSSRSRSRSIPIRNGSPSFLEKRRITSARKRPIPYTRANHSSSSSSSEDEDDFQDDYDSYYYSSSRSRSRSWSSRSSRSSQSSDRSKSRSRSRSHSRSRSRSYSFSP
eukprot:TRINITY_DN930_c1_g1_i9.p1 TRINITY_DN930_c1_g1~~TRINITY_DN930_c1_g1_i9.p1  ORF type:complete len:552 (-),score=147.77 TRINITY_DN930_c1_g1_i9:2793-4448(-)